MNYMVIGEIFGRWTVTNMNSAPEKVPVVADYEDFFNKKH